MSKYTPNRHKMLLELIEGQPPMTVFVKMRRGDRAIELHRELIDVMKGKQGRAISCANARCAIRLAGKAFPHPAIFAEFTDRRAYIVDKLRKRDGMPYSCVVYDHYEGSFQKEFDTMPKSRLAKLSGVDKVFKLYPPARNLPGEGRRDNGRPSPTGSNTNRNKPGSRKLLKGSLARFERYQVGLVKKAG